MTLKWSQTVPKTFQNDAGKVTKMILKRAENDFQMIQNYS